MTFEQAVPLISFHMDGVHLPCKVEQNDRFSGKLSAVGAFGQLEIILHFLDPYVTWNCTYRIEQDCRLQYYFPRPQINFQYLFQNGLTLEIDGHPDQFQNSEQYLILYVPAVPSVINLTAGNYHLFGISVPQEDFRQRWANHTPLPLVMENTTLRQPVVIQNRPLWINRKMQELINDLRECPYDYPLKKTYLDIKTSELIFNSLHNLQSQWFQEKLKNKDIELIEAVRTYLIDHLHDPGNLRSIAKHFGINEFKLKMTFKHVYGNTIYGFVFEERMQQAWDLLINSQKTISEVANSVSYSNLSAFSSAFKRRFGYPPTYLRQKA